MELKLSLKKHCIKTEIKKQYEKYLSNCLKGLDIENSEFAVEKLKFLLEKKDLVSLRLEHKELGGKTDDKVSLFLEEKDYLIINLEKRVDI